MNIVAISVGSNIEPEKNVDKAKEMLIQKKMFIKESNFYKTKPLGFLEQAEFLNGAFLIKTESGMETLTQELKQLEIELGRVKTENKNGPRCIDLDIVVWNKEIVDEDFYHRDFIKKTVLELIPDLQFNS